MLISAFRRLSSTYDETVPKLMEQMVERSDNIQPTPWQKWWWQHFNARITEYAGSGLTTFRAVLHARPTFAVLRHRQIKDTITTPNRTATPRLPGNLGLLLEDIYFCAKEYGGSPIGI